jgi:hypothetical protein
MRSAVPHSAELARVLALPRREWESEADEVARALTELLRRPGGSMALRPIQAMALKEAYDQQGLLAPIGVGHGKTLISLLLAYVLDSQRPVLVLPAGLIEKTKREWQILASHWMIPNWITLKSYETFGRVGSKGWLEQYEPDLIVFDEAQRVKNRRKAAVTKKFEKHIRARREREAAFGVAFGDPRRLRVCAMSGTITSKSPKDFAHIMQWCIPHHSCVPWTWVELEDWHLAIGELQNPNSRIDPGALLAFCDERENDAADATEAARRGFQRRLRATPGVIATAEGHLGTSILIGGFEHEQSAPIEAAFAELRRSWTLPDGWELIDGAAVWAHARQLALGFYYVWDPRPPFEWMLARACWAAFARNVIKRGKYDSEQDVALHAHLFRTTVNDVLLSKGLPPHENDTIGQAHVYEHWCSIRDTFRPNKVARWICDSVLGTCTDWMRKHPAGIVWTEHTEFGLELERVSGFPYFGRKGLDSRGRMIEDADGPIIASIDANKTGRNLQLKWSDNLITACPGDGEEFEQLLGRTHRPLQPADTVNVDVFLGCVENAAAFWKAVSRAHYMQQTTGNAQKLCYADNVFPSLDEFAVRSGPRWQK